MQLLLDSHILIWSSQGRENLPEPIISALADPGNDLYLSVASLWEIGIKSAKGKLTLPPGFYENLDAQPIAILPVEYRHARRASDLPFHHGDPFDRMLVAQALVEGLTLVTRDAGLARYGCRIMAA